MGAGLWLDRDSYVDTAYLTSDATFTMRVKVRPDAQTASSPCIATRKQYFAGGFTEFPFDLIFLSGTFSQAHDSGNDFSADFTLSSSAGFEIGEWYDIVSVHKASSYQRLWVARVDGSTQGAWYEQAVGAMSGNSRNICIGRAPAENGGGVNNSGFIGEIAHFEYWTGDMTQGASASSWLRSWRPPMREGQAVPSGLTCYIPFDDRSGAVARDLAGGTTRTITGSSEWRLGFSPRRDVRHSRPRRGR